MKTPAKKLNPVWQGIGIFMLGALIMAGMRTVEEIWPRQVQIRSHFYVCDDDGCIEIQKERVGDIFKLKEGI